MSSTGSSSGGPGGAGPGGKSKFFDDLAGMAGGAFSVMAGLRTEAEAMVRAQTEAMIQRFDLVKREELDAAMEVARRASEAVAALEARIAALEVQQPAPTPFAVPSAGSGDGGGQP